MPKFQVKKIPQDFASGEEVPPPPPLKYSGGDGGGKDGSWGVLKPSTVFPAPT